MKTIAYIAPLGAALLLPTVSRASTSYYIETAQTGAQTQIDMAHTSTWDFVPAWGWSAGGGVFTMKEGSQTVANVTLTLYDITDSSIVDSVTLTPASLTSSFTATDYFFATSHVLIPGLSYEYRLTSPAVNAQNLAYFIKNDGTFGFADSQGNPLPAGSGSVPEPSSLAFLSGGAGVLFILRKRAVSRRLQVSSDGHLSSTHTKG